MEHNESNSQICIACQACCRVLTFERPPMEKRTLDFYRARGCKIFPVKYTGQDNLQYDIHAIMVPTICPHLTMGGCDIWDARPQACRDYDGREDPYLQDVCQLPKED